MKPFPSLSTGQDEVSAPALCDYYVIVGFANAGGAEVPTEITFVADYDLALEMAQEDEPSMTAIAAYLLKHCPDGDGYRRPVLLHSKGALPDGWDELPKDFLFQV